jgi:A/G-specific adenine glycosylase
MAIDADLRRRVARKLLAWFRRHRRDQPWRRDRDPYRIWVSEVMLQQTQAATVVRFFEPFLNRFPTVAALAEAEEQDVFRLWEGMGYYRRARHLHQAARELAARHQGRIPDDPEILRTLPGVGRYILGAVLSQAFDRRLPILEANSERVLCRLFGETEDPRRGPVRRWLWQAAEGLLPARQVGDFNQALMELGALVCAPAAPRCGICPLAQECVARRRNLQDQIPAHAPPPATVAEQEAAVVVRRGEQVFLVQRPGHSRWAGMWEFPHGSVAGSETHEEAAARLLTQLTGLRANLGTEFLTVCHSVTHHRITLVCFEAQYRSGTFRSEFYTQGRWVGAHELHDFPVSAPQRRLAQALIGDRQQQLF